MTKVDDLISAEQWSNQRALRRAELQEALKPDDDGFTSYRRVDTALRDLIAWEDFPQQVEDIDTIRADRAVARNTLARQLDDLLHKRWSRRRHAWRWYAGHIAAATPETGASLAEVASFADALLDAEEKRFGKIE